MPFVPLALRSLFVFGLLLTLSACDFARSDLKEEQPEDTPPVSDPPEGVCTAEIDGEAFTAGVANAAMDLEDDTLDIVCEEGDIELLFRLRPNAFEPATIPLGGPSGRVQLRVGEQVTVTVSDEAGEVVLDAFTLDRVAGTFHFTVPGFAEDDPPIRVMMGAFDIEIP